jgi:hypothetical protein
VSAPDPKPPAASDGPVPGKAAPAFARPPQAVRRDLLRLAGWVAVPVLLALLVLQVLLADRARLAADADWRPRLLALCRLAGCRLPPWREPSAFHVTAGDLRPHPSARGVLLVTATFRNDARYAQAWPQLQLSLANLDGEPLGLRRFQPRDYLGADPRTPVIEPGQSASVTLEVLDPGKRAVRFEFAFR